MPSILGAQALGDDSPFSLEDLGGVEVLAEKHEQNGIPLLTAVDPAEPAAMRTPST